MSSSSSPMSGLTDDLVEEILARVPATSLRLLRTTCKKWNTLFNDRRFTKKHFDKAEKEYLDLILRNVSLSCMSVNLHGLHDNIDPSAIELKGEFSLENFQTKLDNIYHSDVFHCNGFFLCRNTSTTVVWNPCTGQTKWIPTNSPNTWYEYALGYINKKSCQDYKILRFLKHEPSELEIFEFNSDSWRVSGNVNPNFKLQISDGVSVKGNTYWIDYHHESHGSCFLISFDFTTERFGPRVCLPSQGHFDSHAKSLYSVREERLSVLIRNDDALKIEIWVTNDIIETNVMSCSKFLWLDFNDPEQFWDDVNFFIDEENKFAVVFEFEFHDETLLVSIIEEARCRRVDLGDGPWKTQLFSYVPNLVQI